jgi:hypothetical protein
MKSTQYSRIAKLLTRKSGATAMEIASVAGTVSPHSRLAEMKRAGWQIVREALEGKNYGRYRGTEPQA